jgi:MOSC domain-containing protein YiiM
VNSKILSLNIAHPETIAWDGKSIESSMHKHSVPHLDISMTHIEGDSFANTKHHGTPDAVLYAYGADAIADFMKRLGRTSFENGDLGENITLDVLDEGIVSVGDVFKIGGVIAQATFPRIPCSKINFRVQDPLGQKVMIDAGRSGVYFRILKPGRIVPTDAFRLFEAAKVRFTITEVYERMVGGMRVTPADVERVRANGAFPEQRIARWLAARS